MPREELIQPCGDHRLSNRVGHTRDFGYAVFGKVVKGQEVVDKIAQVPTQNMGPYQNVPVKPVVILSAKILP